VKDGVEIPVQLEMMDEGIATEGQIYEFLGTPSEDGTLRAEARFDVSDNFDMETYNRMLLLAHGKFSSLFWEK